MKIRYIDKDDIRLITGLGNYETIKEGDVMDFPEEMAKSFLRDTKTITTEKHKAKLAADGKTVIPAVYTTKIIPKWEVAEEEKKKGGK